MDVTYVPPTQDELECNYLRRNFLTCLKEKSVKDDVSKMNCNVELILWYNIDCPDSISQFKNPEYLRKTFLQQKKLDKGPKPTKWIKLG